MLTNVISQPAVYIWPVESVPECIGPWMEGPVMRWHRQMNRQTDRQTDITLILYAVRCGCGQRSKLAGVHTVVQHLVHVNNDD